MSAIAESYSQLNDPAAAKTLLEQALTNVERTDNPQHKANALSAIAKTYAELEAWRQVNQTAASCTSNDCKAEVLSTGLTVRAEQLHPELKEEEEE
ncbi:MAG: hypothetical protein HC836_40080 [Richelia sp. RM2_1_2]|nr:hypothetical protein [Richelia sp. RM2_1_2]